LWLNSAANEPITNLLLWTDAQDNAAWSKTGLTATANVKVAASGSPVADLLTPAATTGFHGSTQSTTVTASSPYVAYADIEFGGAAFVQVAYDNGASVWAYINIQAGGTIATAATSAGGATGAVGGVTAIGGGIYRVFVGATHSGTTGRILIQPLPAGSGSVGMNYASATTAVTDTIYVSRTGISAGTTIPDYQPNAACLGGSNRRTGGSNLLLWSEDLASPTWGAADITVQQGVVAGPTGTRSASLLTEGVAGTSTFNQVVTVLAGSTVTLSWHVLRGGATPTQWNKIVISSSGGTTRFWFDVQNGVAGTTGPSAGTHTVVTSGVTSAGSNFYRAYLTVTVATDTSITGVLSSATADNNNTRLNNATYYATGGMINLGALATYSRNMEVIGGLLTSAVLSQDISGDRGTRASRPLSWIRNRLSNNMMTGAVAPSTLPNTWFNSNLRGLTQTLSAVDTTTGTIRIRYSGTPSSSGRVGLFLGNIALGAVVGQTWTPSATLSMVAGAMTNISAVRIDVDEYTSGSVFIRVDSLPDLTLTASPAVYSGQLVLQDATVGGLFMALALVVTSGSAIDITIEITKPQLAYESTLGAIQNVTSIYDITESGQPDVWHTLWDGTSDYGDTGAQSFGTASLFAAAGQQFTKISWGRTLTKGRTWGASKAGATLGNRTNLVLADATSGKPRVNVRGTETELTALSDLTDGAFHFTIERWDGSTYKVRMDSSSDQTATVGSAAEEAVNILVAAYNGGASGLHLGHADSILLDRCLSDSETAQAQSYFNATQRSGL
jgi:hypothetical protein